jgi:hypothetical protein
MVYFQTKNPDWDKFGGPWNGKCCDILLPFVVGLTSEGVKKRFSFLAPPVKFRQL